MGAPRPTPSPPRAAGDPARQACVRRRAPPKAETDNTSPCHDANDAPRRPRLPPLWWTCRCTPTPMYVRTGWHGAQHHRRPTPASLTYSPPAHHHRRRCRPSGHPTTTGVPPTSPPSLVLPPTVPQPPISPAVGEKEAASRAGGVIKKRITEEKNGHAAPRGRQRSDFWHTTQRRLLKEDAGGGGAAVGGRHHRMVGRHRPPHRGGAAATVRPASDGPARRARSQGQPKGGAQVPLPPIAGSIVGSSCAGEPPPGGGGGAPPPLPGKVPPTPKVRRCEGAPDPICQPPWPRPRRERGVACAAHSS